MIAQPVLLTGIRAIIRKYEAPKGYNQYVYSKAAAPFGDLALKTVAEIRALQSLHRRKVVAGKVKEYAYFVPNASTAIGAYQIVGQTLDDMIKAKVVKTTELFTPEVQDRLADWLLLQKRGLQKVLDANSLVKFETWMVTQLANEWESFKRFPNARADLSEFVRPFFQGLRGLGLLAPWTKIPLQPMSRPASSRPAAKPPTRIIKPIAKPVVKMVPKAPVRVSEPVASATVTPVRVSVLPAFVSRRARFGNGDVFELVDGSVYFQPLGADYYEPRGRVAS